MLRFLMLLGTAALLLGTAVSATLRMSRSTGEATGRINFCRCQHFQCGQVVTL